MKHIKTEALTPRRLSKADRRQQLLDTALQIIREEGGDRLTLGHLAVRAGVSKPVTYEHFETRSGLLIALYKALDLRQTNALKQALSVGKRNLADTAHLLATTYIHCAADTGGEWHAIGAALAGSEEKGAVLQELLDGYVQLFASVLGEYSDLSSDELARRCTGLVGAGEALSAAMVQGACTETDAANAFAALIQGGLLSAAPSHVESARGAVKA